MARSIGGGRSRGAPQGAAVAVVAYRHAAHAQPAADAPIVAPALVAGQR
jgi:hypothetical protein